MAFTCLSVNKTTTFPTNYETDYRFCSARLLCFHLIFGRRLIISIFWPSDL